MENTSPTKEELYKQAFIDAHQEIYDKKQSQETPASGFLKILGYVGAIAFIGVIGFFGFLLFTIVTKG